MGLKFDFWWNTNDKSKFTQVNTILIVFSEHKPTVYVNANHSLKSLSSCTFISTHATAMGNTQNPNATTYSTYGFVFFIEKDFYTIVQHKIITLACTFDFTDFKLRINQL